MESGLQHAIDTAVSGLAPLGQPEKSRVHLLPCGEEELQPELLDILRKRTHRYGAEARCHVGVAGLFNFDIAAVTRPDALLLLDVNKEQERLWAEVFAIVRAEPTAEGCKNALRAAVDFDWSHHFKTQNPTDERLTLRGTTGDKFEHYVANAAWLNDPGAYAHLHQLALHGRMATATLDLLEDAPRAQALGQALVQEGYAVDTCYWSNVACYVMPYRIENDRKQYVSAQGDVFASQEGGLTYPKNTFYDTVVRTTRNFRQDWWAGQEQPALPKFEKMLRNISAIGADAESTHILVDTVNRTPPIITYGPPRNLRRLAATQAASSAIESSRA